MRDIYEMLNDINVDMNNYERIEMSDLEKRKIYKELIKSKKVHKTRFKVAAVAAVLAAALVTVPVCAAVISYFNGNTKADYVEPIKKTIENENVSMEILDAARNGDEITIHCRMTFDRDISVLKTECAEYDRPEGSVLSAPPFENSTVYMNGTDLKADLHYGDPIEGALSCRNTKIDGNVLEQTINILDMEPGNGEDHISIQYKDITIGGEVIKGEWSYEYVVDQNAYSDKELETSPLDVKATGINGEVYTLNSFAVTPNGIKIFGTTPDSELPEEEATYPAQATLIRMKATDDMGNEYLMYPQYPKYDTDPEYAVYQIYDGPSDGNDAYPDTWNTEAKSVSIVLEQEIMKWTTKTEAPTVEYRTISEPVTIDLTGWNRE